MKPASGPIGRVEYRVGVLGGKVWTISEFGTSVRIYKLKTSCIRHEVITSRTLACTCNIFFK